LGGKRITVDKTLFIKTINELEAKNTYSNMFALQQAVAASPYGMQIGISNVNVYQYLKKWDVQLKTQKGKRGDGLTRMHDKTNVVRLSGADKLSTEPKAIEWLANVTAMLRKIHPSRYESLIEKIKNGSRKARMAAKCIECSNGYHVEIKSCVCIDCPLFLDRPYKESDDEQASIEVDDELTKDDIKSIPLAIDNG
jgi:hypothetical protein